MPLFRAWMHRSLSNAGGAGAEQSCKAAEGIESRLLSMTKLLKRVVKKMNSLSECCDRLAEGFGDWEGIASASEEEGMFDECLERCKALSVHLQKIFDSLGESMMSEVVEPMVRLRDREVSATHAIKKRCDGAHRSYTYAAGRSSLGKSMYLRETRGESQDREEEVVDSELAEIGEVGMVQALKCFLAYIEGVSRFLRSGRGILGVGAEEVERYRGWIRRKEGELEGGEGWKWMMTDGEGKDGEGRLFGVRYGTLVERSGNLIPEEIDEVMRELESSHLDVKGIFRISPLKHQLDEVKSRLDQGEKIEWKKQDVHTCTGVVKSFLRELPECLSGKKVYAKLLKIGDMEGGESMKSALKEAIDQVPMPNYVLLKRVIRLCYLIDKNREKNMMSAQNLAVVLGPSLLFSPGTAVEEMLQCVRKVNKVVQSMIVNFEEVFTRDEEGDGQRNRSASSGKSAGLSKMLRPPFLRSSSRRLQRLMSNLSPTGQNAEPTNPSNSSNSSSPVEEDDVFARFSKLAEEEAKSRVRVVQSPIKSDEKNLSLGEATKELLFKSSYVQDPENMMFIMNKMLFAVNERVDSEGRLVMAVQSFINQVCKFTSLALAVLCGVDGQLPNLILYLKSTAVSMKSILVLLRKDEMRIDHLQKKTLIHLSSLLHYKTIELASVVKKVEGNQDDTSLYKLSRLTEEYMEICNRFYSFVRLIPSNQKLKEDSKKLILCVKQILLASTHAVPQKVMEIFNDYKIFNSDFVTDVEAIISRHLAEQNNVLTQVV